MCSVCQRVFNSWQMEPMIYFCQTVPGNQIFLWNLNRNTAKWYQVRKLLKISQQDIFGVSLQQSLAEINFDLDMIYHLLKIKLRTVYWWLMSLHVTYRVDFELGCSMISTQGASLELPPAPRFGGAGICAVYLSRCEWILQRLTPLEIRCNK